MRTKTSGGRTVKAIKRRIRSCLALATASVAVSALGATAAVAGYSGGGHLDSDQFAVESFTTGTSSEIAGARTDFRNIFELKNDRNTSSEAPPTDAPSSSNSRFPTA